MATDIIARALAGSSIVLGQGGAAVSHTGDTNEFTLATIAVPAAAMGANGQIKVRALFSKVGTAGAATYRVKYGGTSFHANNPAATTLSYEIDIRISNQNSASVQVAASVGTGGGFGASTAAKATGAIDSTASQNILITGQNASAGDTFALESYQVILYPKA